MVFGAFSFSLWHSQLSNMTLNYSLIQLLYLANITVLQVQHVHLYPNLVLESQNLRNGEYLYGHQLFSILAS